ncbi:2231_t:CDS:2 [Entrophospora sp. SA101]|nr:2231_t:CDS:2 [Entrophospora sp. SA101]
MCRKEYNFTGGGTLVLKTRGSGVQECEIPDQGGKVVFEAKGSSGTITLETTTTTEEKKYRFKHERIEAEREKDYEAKEYDEPEIPDDNTAFSSNIGETDPEALEKLKEFDQEHEQKD